MERIVVKKPSENVLKTYYTAWIAGKTNNEIAKEIFKQCQDRFISPKEVSNYIKKNLPAFHSFCRSKTISDTRKSLSETGEALRIELTPERRADLLRYVSKGKSLEKAADMINVPLLTITEIWFIEDDTLQWELKTIKDKQDIKILEALEKRALGYDLHVAEINDIAEETEKGFKKGTHIKKTKKHVPGSVQAQEFYLINQCGWSNMPSGSNSEEEQTEYDIREKLYEE